MIITTQVVGRQNEMREPLALQVVGSASQMDTPVGQFGTQEFRNTDSRVPEFQI
jgi:hypothetical protein